jgi:nucleotide-binding universal stress UspA family protein
VTGLLIVVFIAGLGQDIEVLAKAASVLHLIVYALMNVALIVFREADTPGYDPDFRVPLYPYLPIAGAVFSLGLVAFMDPIEILLSVAFVVGAIMWFFLYARANTTQAGVLEDLISEREESLPDGVVRAADAVSPNGDEGPTIMVAVHNPETEGALVDLGATLAAHQDGRLLATHVVTVPDQTSLQAAADRTDRFDGETQSLLDAAETDAADYDVPIESVRIYSHRGIEEVFDAAREHAVDTVVMGYGGARLAGGRVEGALDELAHDLPCDFLVLDADQFQADEVLLPTAGGQSSDLSAALARALRETVGSAVTLLHVTGESTVESGQAFLEEWAAEHDLAEAPQRVETGSPGPVIRELAPEYDLLLLGATERGLLSRIVHGSLTLEAFENLDVDLLLAERPTGRSLWKRLVGSGEKK